MMKAILVAIGSVGDGGCCACRGRDCVGKDVMVLLVTGNDGYGGNSSDGGHGSTRC